MRIKINYEENNPDEAKKPWEQPRDNFEKDVNQFSLEVEGVGEFDLRRLQSIVEYDRLLEKAKQSLQGIINLSIFLLTLDVFLFFVSPFWLVGLFNVGVSFSPIPIGATIAICGIQGGWIATLFYQYKTESMKADYVFRGKEAYPSNREK